MDYLTCNFKQDLASLSRKYYSDCIANYRSTWFSENKLFPIILTNWWLVYYLSSFNVTIPFFIEEPIAILLLKASKFNKLSKQTISYWNQINGFIGNPSFWKFRIETETDIRDFIDQWESIKGLSFCKLYIDQKLIKNLLPELVIDFETRHPIILGVEYKMKGLIEFTL